MCKFLKMLFGKEEIVPTVLAAAQQKRARRAARNLRNQDS